MAPPPVSEARLKQIASDAVTVALSGATTYKHEATQEWNQSIINHILKSLIEDTSKDTPNNQPPFKFAVNSTIVQHHPPTASESAESPEKLGRRGMHSASGAYWNSEKDGMWSYKWDGEAEKGMDVVISILWFAV